MRDVPAQRAVSLPAPALRACISRYAGVHAEGLRPGTHAGVPSRHAHLIISFGEPIELLRPPAGGQQQPGRFTALVSGLHDGPALVRMASRVPQVHVFFYDQSHMTREWRALAGCSPRQWIAQELPFLQDDQLPLGEEEV